MAPPKSAPAEPSKPTQSRFLIALFLAKSKPSNLSTQEYISSLRSCVQGGRRLDDPSNSHSHVNTAEFWRNEFKRSEEAQTELRARIFKLEKMLDAREQSKSATTTGSTSQNKRRRVDELTLQEDGGSFETFVNNIKSSSDHDGAFLQRFYFLQQLMSQTNVEFKVLATVLCQISSDVRRIISSVKSSQSYKSTKNLGGRNRATRDQQQNNTQDPSSVDRDLDTKLGSIARIFPYLLESLDKANKTAQDRGLQGHVIYSYIEILRDLLARICLLSTSQGKKKNPDPRRSANGRFIPTARRKSATPLPPCPPDETVLKLSNLLLALASALDTTNAAENAIMEGFLFFLLTRVGTALKVFVFGNDCKDFLGLNPQIEAKAADCEHDEKRTEAQAPHLVYLLDRLIPMAPLGPHHSSRVSSISLTPPPPPPTPTPAPRLAPHSLTRLPTTTLQSTLLHAVFNSSAKATEFSDALTSPALPTAPPPRADCPETVLGKTDNADGVVGDWFKMEVWRIIGWNILSGQIGPS